MNENTATTDPKLDELIERDPADGIVMPKEDEIESEPLVYFCKTCKKLVDTPKAKSKKNAYTFICPECKEENVSWGTRKSIFNFFHLNNEGEAVSKKKDKGNQVARLVEAKEEAKERKANK